MANPRRVAAAGGHVALNRAELPAAVGRRLTLPPQEVVDCPGRLREGSGWHEADSALEGKLAEEALLLRVRSPLCG